MGVCSLKKTPNVELPLHIHIVVESVSLSWRCHANITVTSWWARWRLKSRASPLFALLVQVQIKKHQSSASLAFVRGIHRWPVHFPHKRPVTRKIFPFYDVIMNNATTSNVERRPDIKQKITSISHTSGWAISCLCKYFWYKLTVFWWDLCFLCWFEHELECEVLEQASSDIFVGNVVSYYPYTMYL